MLPVEEQLVNKGVADSWRSIRSVKKEKRDRFPPIIYIIFVSLAQTQAVCFVHLTALKRQI